MSWKCKLFGHKFEDTEMNIPSAGIRIEYERCTRENCNEERNKTL
ncbi:DUF1660 family phage protein [Bacillus subtilis]|nr:hypothetical protein ANABIO4_38410 [Bacillus subtilis]